MLDQEVITFLEHFGIKGQQWGVRRANLKAARATYRRLTPEVNTRQITQRYMSTLNPTSFARLSDKDVVIKKGSVVKRTTNNLARDAGLDRFYVSTTEADATNYRGLVPIWTNKKDKIVKNYSQNYETTFKAVNNLRSPSERKRVEGYVALMDKKEIRLANGETVNGREYLRQNGLGSVVDKLNNRDLALTYYGQLVSSQGMPNEPLHSAYFKSLQAKGYNAVIDDNDKNILSKMPMLVLNKKDLSTVSVRELTTTEIHQAQANLKLP